MGGLLDAKELRDYVNRNRKDAQAPQTSGYISVVPAKSRADLPNDAAARKEVPIVTGVLDYFPDAIAEVARVSFAGNQQHNPGQPLHWAREKSTDHEDCIGRHTLQRGTRDTDGQRHTAKRAWRALAALQIEIEEERKRFAWGTVGEPGTIVEIGGGGAGMSGCGNSIGNQNTCGPAMPGHVFNGKGKV